MAKIQRNIYREICYILSEMNYIFAFLFLFTYLVLMIKWISKLNLKNMYYKIRKLYIYLYLIKNYFIPRNFQKIANIPKLVLIFSSANIKLKINHTV